MIANRLFCAFAAPLSLPSNVFGYDGVSISSSKSASSLRPRAVAATPSHRSPDSVRRSLTSSSLNQLTNRKQTKHGNIPVHPYRVTIVTSDTDGLEQLLNAIKSLLSETKGTVRQWRSLGATALDAQVLLPFSVHIDTLRTDLYHLGRQVRADIVLQEESIISSPKRLAVFDLDSTLIAQETIDELASEVNVETEVKAITHRAMNGEMGFREALSARVAFLKGLPLHALDGVKDRVVFTPGAFELIRALRSLGCKTAVVSGGFHFLADHVKDVLGLDYAFANRLEVDFDGILTGRTTGEIVDAEYKEKTLQKLSTELSLNPEEVLAVGDGSNDLLMMHRAGLGIAFNAKPVVQDRAKFRVNQNSLVDVLYLLGFADSDIEQLVSDALEP